ncbi:restriction endonuclease fold toxin 5 domain-containing protein [Photorhabdus aegyptia]|uniref:Restriction endonuclease fold toxin 5 n=1 Tax=Photorhabdus aegyptia TaxID=2805098 RepID=A0A022PG03_9GAMM|nr:restriction endonuclease fold toxin 5 domain-containing protein [Photorhabdus aegyptia]EYU15067.1 Restriction endonuclease fold toxin 5 [Photorhabdus aegyptia]
MPIPLLAPVAVGAAEYVASACAGVLIAVGIMEAGKDKSVIDDDSIQHKKTDFVISPDITDEDRNIVWSAEAYADFWEDDDLGDESVDASAVQTKAQSETEECEKTETEKVCKACLAIPVTSEKYRKVSRWSAITINYQRFIAKTKYNPVTQMIQEFQCLKVTFDGWRPAYCLFLEAKARYDQFFKDNKPKRWWTGRYSAKNQAERHQMVCDALDGTPHVEWHFFQPISYGYFKVLFSKYKNISVHYTPCNSLV